MISDRRLKENITNVSQQELNKIYSLSVKEFNFIDAVPQECLQGKHSVGLIADEIADVFPEMVAFDAIERHIVHSYLNDGLYFNEDQMNIYGAGPYEFMEDGVYRIAEYQQISYNAFIPYLLATINDLNTRLTLLESN
jgi:hypothetical protein